MAGLQYPLLASLDEHEQRDVLALARRRRFKKGEVLFHHGDPADSLHLVAKGHVAIRVTTPLGDVATLRVVKPGEHFGELALIDSGPRSATAVALDPVDTLVLARDHLREYQARWPGIDAALRDALVAEVRRLAGALVDALYLPVDRRLWRRLAELAAIYGPETETVTIPLSQEDLAQLAGTTRSTANKLLQPRVDEGIIELARGRINVLNREALARLAR